MNVEIRKLTPDLAEDYAYFFDTTPHDDNVPEHTCYCVCWCSADHRAGTHIPSREERRTMAVEYVKNGKLQGYLAYSDGRIVGWCNANTKAECQNCFGWNYSLSQVKSDPGEKVKSLFCFLVAPDMKRKGIAKQLLQRVYQDALDDALIMLKYIPKRTQPMS